MDYEYTATIESQFELNGLKFKVQEHLQFTELWDKTIDPELKIKADNRYSLSKSFDGWRERGFEFPQTFTNEDEFIEAASKTLADFEVNILIDDIDSFFETGERAVGGPELVVRFLHDFYGENKEIDVNKFLENHEFFSPITLDLKQLSGEELEQVKTVQIEQISATLEGLQQEVYKNIGDDSHASKDPWSDVQYWVNDLQNEFNNMQKIQEAEWFSNSKNKEIDSDLITKTLEERTPEQIAAWNAQGGAPALLEAYWAGLDDKQRGELIQYVRYYNETNYNTDVFFDHDTGAIDDLENHNIESVEEEKFEALGLTDEVKREYQTLWTMLNDSSVDQPYRLANISELELEKHFNKLQNLLNNEQDQLEVSSKNIEQISINGLQEELLDIETRAENLNLKLTDAQRDQIQALPPEGRRYILDSLENDTPDSQVSTNFHTQNQVETDLDMEIF